MVYTVEFTDEQVADIVQRFTSGQGVKPISLLYKCSGKPITRILKEQGVFEPERRWNGMFTPEQKDEIVARYQAGATQRELGKQYGCVGGNIRALLIRRKVPLREPGHGGPSPEIEARMREMRSNGATVAEMAVTLAVPVGRALRWTRLLELPEVRRVVRSGKPIETKKGYWLMWVDSDDPMYVMAARNGYVPLHRLVMARALGRPLTDTETVHHINTDKSDNTLGNLQLRQGKHGKGGAFECLDCGSHNVQAVPLASPRKAAAS